MKDRSKCRKGCDCTGIGAIACLRHGCYAPGAMVDFQKGERQMNIDYALCEALANTHTQDAPHCIFVYDINCQYITNLRARIAAGEFLKINDNLFFVPGIGLFHVHGHQVLCYPRFAPTFIDGAGQADGEILETLWAVLNEAARSTRTMTLAHRAEVLDAHAADNNWKKMINMGNFLRHCNYIRCS